MKITTVHNCGTLIHVKSGSAAAAAAEEGQIQLLQFPYLRKKFKINFSGLRGGPGSAFFSVTALHNSSEKYN